MTDADKCPAINPRLRCRCMRLSGHTDTHHNVAMDSYWNDDDRKFQGAEMSTEENRKKAYAYVARLIVYDADTFVDDPETYTEVIKIRDALRLASETK